VDLVEGTAPSETKKEIVYGVRAGKCGITGHSRSIVPTVLCVCVREREREIDKEENFG
jgi:hypothetical protein